MKIALFVSVLDQRGGAEIGTYRLAERFARRGHRVTVLTTQALSQWRRQRSVIDYTNPFRIIRLPVWQRNRHVFRRMLFIQTLWALPLFLHGTQILFMWGLMPETLSLAKIARRLGLKTLCVPMASGAYGDVATFPRNVPHDPQAFSAISALTESLRAEVVAWGFPAERASVIPNGVDTDLYHPTEYPCAVPRVIFVGQFRPEKRIDLLLQAWQRVVLMCPQAQLTLVGGGHNLPEYERLASNLGVTPRFVPNTDTANVLKHLQNSSVFVMSGVSEGMSNALLEAMAVGLAPVVSNTPANRAVVTPEINGLTYRADSPEALAEQLVRLCLNESLRQRLGAEARKTVEQRFTLDSVTDQYLALYGRLLGDS